ANDFMLNERDKAHDLVYIPSHGLETGDSFYFIHKKSRAKQAEIIKLTNWLKQQCL
ncbi:LysR family transcriptional regulator, partial [Vibrio diabolicus]